MFFGAPLLPQPRKPLTALCTQALNGDVLVRGIVEDETLFSNMVFKTLTEALHYLKRRYNTEYRVVINLPGNVRRD
jgi:hypothetical protein